MRLWHKKLISVLPHQQLIGQWRECCLIAKNIYEKGNPNHVLVNKIMDYPIGHFISYAQIVYNEMKLRGYNCDSQKFLKWITTTSYICYDEMFINWHNNRYLNQCYYNLQEKYDCGGIKEEEWKRIQILINKGERI